MIPKYPDVEVKLTGSDGNAMAVISAVARKLRLSGVPAVEIETFITEATAGNYANVLYTAMLWVNVS